MLMIYFYYHGADVLGGPRHYTSEADVESSLAEKAAKEAFFSDLDPWQRRSIRSCEVYDANRKLVWKWEDEVATNQTILKTGWKVVRQHPRAFIPLKIENGRWVRNGPPYIPEKR